MTNTQGRWIWYPGDFEAFLGLRTHSERSERGTTISPYWRMEAPYPNVKFTRTFDLDAPCTFTVHADGDVAVETDALGHYEYDFRQGVTLGAGRHLVQITVFNATTFPSLLVRGDGVYTDESWRVGPFRGDWVRADAAAFDDPASPPSAFRLETEPVEAASRTAVAGGELVDFGREMKAFLCIEGVEGSGSLVASYGESDAEALDVENSYIIETIDLEAGASYRAPHARAFRYVFLRGDARYRTVRALYEYLPLRNRAAFRTESDVVNRIYDVSAYTLHLNSREFLLDGIKRDHWVWGGDAAQSYLLQFYSFFDLPICRRTMRLLVGKPPVRHHHNFIQDYTSFWFASLVEYHMHTGDADFLRSLYPMAVQLMDFCRSREDARGFMMAQPDDWVFVDWAPMDNAGDVSFEQLMYARALECMAYVADLVGDADAARAYRAAHEHTKASLFDAFWSEARGCFTHGPASAGDARVTKYTNMFALTYGYLAGERAESAVRNGMLDPAVQEITTPYMRFYELMALCEIGQHDLVARYIVEYWGAMLEQGATSFWEQYIPGETGVQHYAMYGKPFFRSLCHAWGAGPLLLLGRYFLGVRPTEPGYARFAVEPRLFQGQWVEGRVPTPDGDIDVRFDGAVAEVVNGTPFAGTLRALGREIEIPPRATARIER